MLFASWYTWHRSAFPALDLCGVPARRKGISYVKPSRFSADRPAHHGGPTRELRSGANGRSGVSAGVGRHGPTSGGHAAADSDRHQRPQSGRHSGRHSDYRAHAGSDRVGDCIAEGCIDRDRDRSNQRRHAPCRRRRASPATRPRRPIPLPRGRPLAPPTRPRRPARLRRQLPRRRPPRPLPHRPPQPIRISS